jgi:AcrR family transcriptional regulator
VSTRERLLQAAREVVDRDGLEGLTLRAIARHAGVSHGAPLRHFPSLAKLLAAVGAAGFARLVTTIDDGLAAAEAASRDRRGSGLTPTERIAVAGEAYIDFALAEPGVFAVTFRPERVDVTDPDYQTQGYRSFRQLVDLVTAAQSGGWHPDEPADVLAAVLWAHVHGLAELRLHGALGGVVDADRLAGLHRTSAGLTLGPLDLPDPPEDTADSGDDHQDTQETA